MYKTLKLQQDLKYIYNIIEIYDGQYIETYNKNINILFAQINMVEMAKEYIKKLIYEKNCNLHNFSNCIFNHFSVDSRKELIQYLKKELCEKYAEIHKKYIPNT
jgi:hypothetical protein